MVKVALIGAGKMGISHLSILGANKDVEMVGVCDTSKMVNNFLSKFGGFNCFTEYQKMIEQVKPDAVFVAAPTKFHYQIIKELLERKIHVFAEKPFCLKASESKELVRLAAVQDVINQVGYHNKFIGTFKEVKRIIQSGALGNIYHFVGESYGPVVVRPKQDNWRSDPLEGGGCLHDYASHVIDLINDLIAPISSVKGGVMNSVFSKSVDDSVYALLELENKVNGILSVNWSDETYRKMSTTVTIVGTKGKVIANASELKIYLKDNSLLNSYTKGWNLRNITDLTDPVEFNLRGEEYTAQIDYFVNAVAGKVPNTINTFLSAYHTDRSIEIIKANSN